MLFFPRPRTDTFTLIALLPVIAMIAVPVDLRPLAVLATPLVSCSETSSGLVSASAPSKSRTTVSTPAETSGSDRLRSDHPTILAGEAHEAMHGDWSRPKAFLDQSAPICAWNVGLQQRAGSPAW